MKKALKRMMALLLALLLLSAPAASAEYARGDRGDGVAELQLLLFETGWLFELPDGVFGGNTEEAVKGFEQYAGLPVDGVADEEFLYELAVSLENLNAGTGIVSEYFGEYPSRMFAKPEKQEGGGIGHSLLEQAALLGGKVSEPETVALNASVIVDGDKVYYTGEAAGEGHGVYVMDLDGGNRRRISDIQATIKAVSGGSVLVWRYDDAGYAALEVLQSDGSLVPVGYKNYYAIARDGRFYFGGSSVAEDGTDLQQHLAGDSEFLRDCYPVEAMDGYLYYLNASSDTAFFAGGGLPCGDVEFNRVHLETGEVELISGAGTCYLGMEDGALYYTREDFDIFDYQSGNTFTMYVDDGLYALDTETLTEEKLAEISDEDLIFEYYTFLEDGVVYGEYFDYTQDTSVHRILRRKTDGEELPPLDIWDEISVLRVRDGVLYGVQTDWYETETYYFTREYIVAHDLTTGKQTQIPLGADEAMYYTEMRPCIAVVNGRVLYYTQDETDGTEYVKSASVGGDVITLIKSEPLY